MQTDQRPSRAKRIVFRILATPFIIAFVLSALMVIFCLFNIDKEWWFGGLVGFVIIGAVTGFIALFLWSFSMDPPDPETMARYQAEHEERRKAKEQERQERERQREQERLRERESETSAPVSGASTPKTETVTGSYAAKTYVYDPKPILRVPEGKAFIATVVTRNITLKSKLTGGTWETGVDDGYALAYKGTPFGVLFNGIATVHIRELMASGATEVRLTAIRQGWYQHGYPEVYVLVPTMEEARAREQAEKNLREYEQRQAFGFAAGVSDHIFRIGETSWNAPDQVPDEGYATFTVTVEQLPAPEGSNAKPHIILKEQNRIIAEITARSSATYLTLTPLVGKRLKLLVQKYYTSYNVEANEI